MKKTLLEYLLPIIEEGEKYIRAGKVKVNGEKIIIPSTKINSTDNVEIIEVKEWVSRGAYKLLDAIEKFKIDFSNKVVLDIGSSTGGFTEVALKHRAKKIYALDVGTNQLDYKIRMNKKVVTLEKTNLKTIEKKMFNENIEIVTADVSFISLKRVFDVLEPFSNIEIMALIKPQFEANSNLVKTGGIVQKIHHKSIIHSIISYAQSKNFKNISVKTSPILGNKSKNIEYISYFKKF